MGRRKIPHTLEEIREEKLYYEKKRRQEENRVKTLQNAIKSEERKNRTRRLCTEAGTIEGMVPELKVMDDKIKNKLFKAAFASKEAEDILNDWRVEHEEEMEKLLSESD